MERSMRRMATYILPIRSCDESAARELGAYLATLDVGQIVVVDASDDRVYHAHAAAFPPEVEHVRPDGAILGRNGKVRNVLSGLARARGRYIVVADDDVRYDRLSLDEVLGALADADVVRPQNYFSPVPWHALLDNARQLINRGLDGDWPGTLAFRNDALPRGYNADALFENFELIRTVRARGGVEQVLYGTFVRRLPPKTPHFLDQRVRQAYDEFARPLRLTAALALLPCAIAGAVSGRWWIAGALLLAGEAIALRGLLRARAYRYISPFALAFVPLWMFERAVCAWAALYARLRYGGIRYAGVVVRDAVCSTAELQRRWAA
jgi:cellulose synthase/poly-beta-1,6-N-acetylglucosamine synthase-like glycosyltransferase